MTKQQNRWLSLAFSLMAAVIISGGLLTAGQAWAQDATDEAIDPHSAAFSEDKYPSANVCRECHELIYDQWASSNHAYASLSPMFHKFEQKISALSSGTIGTFCLRCHAQVSTQMGEKRYAPMWERTQVSREGITCITCHRVNASYNKVNGERYVIPGDIHQPVYSTSDGSGLEDVVENADEYRVAVKDGERGAKIHTQAIQFSDVGKSEFCVSCHQVAVHPGIKLEVVWDQYRASPAAEHGIECQDCHMGIKPGVFVGDDPSDKSTNYPRLPSAIVAGKEINPDRLHHNHAFYGPGYPIAHPGVFPHNPDAENWTMEEWLEFNYRQPWGDPDWEDLVEEGEIEAEFPDIWEDRYDREEAREIIEKNQELLEEKRRLRVAVMENGSRIDGPYFDDTPEMGKSWSFSYKVTNTDEGHNLPSGSLGAQPEIWMNVALADPDGNTVFESGYVDSIGDMADIHSLDVAAGTVPYDSQLFNLQTKFLTTNVKGTDREMYLPFNVDIDQIPHIRPANVPTTVLNHPPFIRMEGRSIPPLGHRFAKYKVPASAFTKPGTYKLSVRMRSRAEPMYFMRFVDATIDMEQSMNDWMIDIHPYTVEIEVK